MPQMREGHVLRPQPHCVSQKAEEAALKGPLLLTNKRDESYTLLNC